MKRSVLDDWRVLIGATIMIVGLTAVTETGAVGLYLFSILTMVGLIFWDKRHESPHS